MSYSFAQDAPTPPKPNIASNIEKLIEFGVGACDELANQQKIDCFQTITQTFNRTIEKINKLKEGDLTARPNRPQVELANYLAEQAGKVCDGLNPLERYPSNYTPFRPEPENPLDR